mmetsp:Transcript_110206/g.310828  ORF Transcript_110206/g.310828 Transcript_110206/m.310828 type:complete len:569 (+) Transcript_110206:58-1764(+)
MPGLGLRLPNIACRHWHQDQPGSAPARPTLLPSLRRGDPASPPSKEDATISPTNSSVGRERSSKRQSTHIDCRAFVPERVDMKISRRYSIGKVEIGSGGCGKVFTAEDREVQGRRVAIKKVRVRDEAVQDAFRREVLIMKDLVHPNICKLLETYDEGKYMYLIMELCEGGEVFDRIMQHGPMTEKATARIVKQVAGAVKYAHGKGIAHRDLKPENICFCTDDPNDTNVKVIDWGVGFHFGFSRMQTEVGSATYMAPEVLGAFSGEGGYSSACDLWSLGVLTYIMLCGKPPFYGTTSEQLDMMRNEQIPMDDPAWQTISSDAIEFIRSLIKFVPEERLDIDEVLAHPWLSTEEAQVDATAAERVLSNLSRFRKRRSNASRFYWLCMASVAQQLDHRSLRDVRQVFHAMDRNGDGLLTVQEVRTSLARIFGQDSTHLKGVEDMFARLDLDGSGRIDYSEFCAAAIGDCSHGDGQALRAAFKAFDIVDDDGRITQDDITEMLARANAGNQGAGRTLPREKCEEVAGEIFKRFDQDGDGFLDFEEWRALMQQCAVRCMDSNAPSTDVSPSTA